jgi:aminoglycoside phosphotransferase (APT) family kinase protein
MVAVKRYVEVGSGRPARERAAAEALALATFKVSGVAPELLWEGTSGGEGGDSVLVYHWAEGYTAREQELGPKGIEACAAALHTVHSSDSDVRLLAPQPRSLDGWWLAVHQMYREVPQEQLRDLPRSVDDMLVRLIQSVAADAHAHKRFWQGASLTPVHGAVLPENMIVGEGGVTLVDWQLYGLGDPAYEAAASSLRLAGEIGEEAGSALAERYLAKGDDTMLARRVAIYRRIWSFGYALEILTSFLHVRNAETRERSVGSAIELLYHLRRSLDTYGWSQDAADSVLSDLSGWLEGTAPGNGNADA